MKKHYMKGIVVLTLTMSMGGCNMNNNDKTEVVSLEPLSDFKVPNYNVSYYNNMQFNAYYNKKEADMHLPEQGIYGSGNAFILRYDGIYYMYLGSSNYMDSGVACYMSKDLMTWEQVDNGINTLGKVAEDSRLYFTYPPCVSHYNNKFYMYLYIKNNVITQGNYILEADSPIGPFKFVCSDGINPDCYTIAATSLDIDCDIFIDDNEDTYFMSAYQDSYFTGIRAFKMNSMDKVEYDSNSYINIAESTVGGWTEGNGIFKRNGNYYLMYTGSNILSPGYLTHYSTAIDDSWKNAFGSDNKVNASGFTQGMDFPMGCETDPTFYSVGHATSVLGPDMDGLYYHYFSVNSSGPNATFAIDRLIFNGASMDTSQAQYHSVTPSMPYISTYNPLEDSNFETNTNSVLSKEEFDSTLSVEYNFVGDNAKCVFDYVNENNYKYVSVDIANKKVNLNKVINGNDTSISVGTIKRDYDAKDLHKTIRIARNEGLIDVYFDDLKKIENASIDTNKGKIGYLYNGNFKPSYLAISKVAKGLSDKIEPKQSYINIGAESYLPLGVYEGCGSSFKNNDGFKLIDKNEFNGKYEKTGKMCLTTPNSTATYIVDFNDDREGNENYFNLYMTLNKNMSNKKIGVRVDGSEMYVLEVPTINPTNNESLVKTCIGQLPISKGIHQISFTCLNDPFEFISFTFTKSAGANFSYSAKLDKAPENGMEQLTLWRFEEKGTDTSNTLTCKEGSRSLVYFGDNSLNNYTVECDFRINGESSSTAGFILEGNRYSNSPYVTEDYKYIQGYYVALNKRMAKIEKLNYTHTDSGCAATRANIEADTWNHIKITKQNNKITVEVTNSKNEVKLLEFEDDMALIGGRFGFYSQGESMSYKNLSIKG